VVVGVGVGWGALVAVGGIEVAVGGAGVNVGMVVLVGEETAVDVGDGVAGG